MRHSWTWIPLVSAKELELEFEAGDATAFLGLFKDFSKSAVTLGFSSDISEVNVVFTTGSSWVRSPIAALA